VGEGKTTYTFSVSANAFSVEFPLACYQLEARVWYVSGALRRTYTLFYSAPRISCSVVSKHSLVNLDFMPLMNLQLNQRIDDGAMTISVIALNIMTLGIATQHYGNYNNAERHV
jgi:hypothetical protein